MNQRARTPLSPTSVSDYRRLAERRLPRQLFDYAVELLKRAHAAGCSVLALTVDLAVLGARYRDARNGMGVALSPLARAKVAFDYARRVNWIFDVALGGRPLEFGNLVNAVKDAKGFSDFQIWINKNLDPGMTWKDLDWIRANWPGK